MYHTCYDNQDLDTIQKGNQMHLLIDKASQRIKVSNFNPMICILIYVYLYFILNCVIVL